MDPYETNGERLMRRLRTFYNNHSIWFILTATLAFVYVLLFVLLPWTTRPPETPEGKPSNPWQINGLKVGNEPLLWVDPQTRCQYLVSHGFSFSMTPRMASDGTTQVCNKPELEQR